MAENDNGRLNFGIGIDLDGLQRGADEAKGVFDGIASEAQAKGADIDRAFGTDASKGFHTLAEAVNATVAQISGMEFGSAEERIGALGQVIQITERAMEDAAGSLRPSVTAPTRRRRRSPRRSPPTTPCPRASPPRRGR